MISLIFFIQSWSILALGEEPSFLSLRTYESFNTLWPNLLAFPSDVADIFIRKVDYIGDEDLYFIAISNKIIIKKSDSRLTYMIDTNLTNIIDFSLIKGNDEILICGTTERDQKISMCEHHNWRWREFIGEYPIINNTMKGINVLEKNKLSMIYDTKNLYYFDYENSCLKKTVQLCENISKCIKIETNNRLLCLCENSALYYCKIYDSFECKNLKKPEGIVTDIFYDDQKELLTLLMSKNYQWSIRVNTGQDNLFDKAEANMSYSFSTLDNMKGSYVCFSSFDRAVVCNRNYFIFFSKREEKFEVDSEASYIFSMKDIHISNKNQGIEYLDRDVYGSLWIDSDSVFFLKKGANISFDQANGGIKSSEHQRISAYYEFKCLNGSDLVLARKQGDNKNLIVFDLVSNKVIHSLSFETEFQDFSLLEDRIILKTDSGLDIVLLSNKSIIYSENITNNDITGNYFLRFLTFTSRSQNQYCIIIFQFYFLYYNVTATKEILRNNYFSESRKGSINFYETKDEMFYLIVVYDTKTVVFEAFGLKLKLINEGNIGFGWIRDYQYLDDGVLVFDYTNYTIISLISRETNSQVLSKTTKEIPKALARTKIRYSSRYFFSVSSNLKWNFDPKPSDDSCAVNYHNYSNYCIPNNQNSSQIKGPCTSLCKELPLKYDICHPNVDNNNIKDSFQPLYFIFLLLLPMVLILIWMRKRVPGILKRRRKPREEEIEIASLNAKLKNNYYIGHEAFPFFNKFNDSGPFNSKVKVEYLENTFLIEYNAARYSIYIRNIDKKEAIDECNHIEHLFDKYFFKLYSTNLVPEKESQIYYVLEDFDINLKDFIEEEWKKNKFDSIVRIIIKVLRLLVQDYSNSGEHFIHGLLTPKKFVLKNDGELKLRVADFGLNILIPVDEEGVQQLIPNKTEYKIPVGEHLYLAPELQINNGTCVLDITKSVVSKTTDLYSLGIIILELLSQIPLSSYNAKIEDTRALVTDTEKRKEFENKINEFWKNQAATSQENLRKILEILEKLLEENRLSYKEYSELVNLFEQN